MNKWGRPPACGGLSGRLALLAGFLLVAGSLAAEEARQIVEESQRRGRADSERYEG